MAEAIDRRFHVTIRPRRADEGYRIRPSRQFAGTESWADTTLAEAIERAKASATTHRERGAAFVDIEIRECMHACEACDRFGSRKTRAGRWVKCRTCKGEPFTFEQRYEATI